MTVVPLLIAMVMPYLLSSKMVSNEDAMIAGLRAYLRAQEEFHKEDRYGIGRNVYANPTDGSGFPDLYQIGGPGSEGRMMRLIDITFAVAAVGGKPKAGYSFADITGDASGPYDYTKQFGLCAFRQWWSRSALNVFIINHDGCVYFKNIREFPGAEVDQGRVPPVTITTWPDVEKDGWLLVVD